MGVDPFALSYIWNDKKFTTNLLKHLREDFFLMESDCLKNKIQKTNGIRKSLRIKKYYFRCFRCFSSLWPFLSRKHKEFQNTCKKFHQESKEYKKSEKNPKTFRWCLDIHWISWWVGVKQKVGDKFWGWTRKSGQLSKLISKKSFGWIIYASILKIQLF